MKSIVIAAIISAAALAGCTSQENPIPVVTITEQVPAPLPAPTTDDGLATNSQEFINFVRQNGGLYGQVANESDLLSLGSTICDGFAGGLSEDEITQVLAQALIKNNMGNDDGAKFGAALIVGARTYLCRITY